MSDNKSKWIKKAIGNDKRGLFGAKAKAAGKTTKEFAEEKKDAGGTLGKEANFALNAMSAGKKRSKMYSHKSSEKMD